MFADSVRSPHAERVFRSRKPGQDETWEAVVVNKSRGTPDGSFRYRYVNIRFADGSTRKIRVDKELWNSLSAGDRLVKRAGSAPVKP
jgi:hypothetical protein